MSWKVNEPTNVPDSGTTFKEKLHQLLNLISNRDEDGSLHLMMNLLVQFYGAEWMKIWI